MPRVGANREASPKGAEMALDDNKLSTVGALIEKARSTPFPNEHEALAVKAYRVLATYLNSLEPEGNTEPRRRERRLLNDRRARQSQTGAPTIDLTDSTVEATAPKEPASGTGAASSEPAASSKVPPHVGAAAAYRGFCDSRTNVGIRLDIAI